MPKPLLTPSISASTTATYMWPAAATRSARSMVWTIPCLTTAPFPSRSNGITNSASTPWWCWKAAPTWWTKPKNNPYIKTRHTPAGVCLVLCHLGRKKAAGNACGYLVNYSFTLCPYRSLRSSRGSHRQRQQTWLFLPHSSPFGAPHAHRCDSPPQARRYKCPADRTPLSGTQTR